jgi:hypothetical protein
MSADPTQPSTNAFPPMQVQAINGSSQQNAALNSFKSGQTDTANMAKLSGGKHRKRRYRGGQTAPAPVVVPQTPKTYSDQSVPAINGSGGILSNLVSTSNQNNANAVYDNQAAVTGGSRKRKARRFLEWPCYSGGKKSTFKKSRGKSRKSRKSRKHHKSRK